MTLDADLDVTVEPDRVAFAVTVYNDGDLPVETTFQSGQTVEVTVRRGSDVVWRYGDERVFTDMTRSVTFAPGERRRYESSWSDPEPGEYDVEATIVGDADATATADLSV